jgi:hypothetical protein
VAELSATIRQNRIETPLNQRLGEVIPLLYDAVLAYGMFVLAQLFIRLQAGFRPTDGHPNPQSIPPADFALALVLFCAVIAFLAQDIAEVVKFAVVCPMRRTSRFSHELIIASLYLITFSLIEQQNLLAWATFGIAVAWGGIWCNQVKEEYKDDKPEVAQYVTTLRWLHYVGGSFFVSESAAFLIVRGSPELDFRVVVCFASTFVLWTLAYAVYPALRHGPEWNHMLVNLLYPDLLIIKLQERVTLSFQLEGDKHV